MTENQSARLRLRVKDERGELLGFRLLRITDAWYAVHGVWSGTGEIEAEVPSGRCEFFVTHGMDHDATRLVLDLQAGECCDKEVTLSRRFDARMQGWVCGESHVHVLHGRKDPPATIADGGQKGMADGLDYIQLAAAWDPSFAWLSTEELNRQCEAASNEKIRVGWNIETPKAYMSEDDGGESGNLHCFGHGWTVGLKDNSRGQAFFSSGPAFRVMQEIHRQGGIVGCAHPVRSSFHKGNFVSNWASELPFDFVAGVPYAAVDILNDSPLLFFQSERLWHALLNLGYKVAGTGNSDGAIGAKGPVGVYRTYTQIRGDFTWEKLAHAMTAGRNIATSGPFVLFEVDGQGPGTELVADGKTHTATVKAWSAPLPDERLTAVQVVRNGEVIRAWDLREENTRTWETSFEIRDQAFSWYCVRGLSSSQNPRSLALWGPHVYELAVANPVYFLPAGFERPQPEPAQLTLAVMDESGEPLAATARVFNADLEISTHELPPSGEKTLTVPATASLRISAPGHRTEERCLYMDCPELFEYCRNMGMVWPSFFSPETYQELRRRLKRLQLTVKLSPEA